MFTCEDMLEGSFGFPAAVDRDHRISVERAVRKFGSGGESGGLGGGLISMVGDDAGNSAKLDALSLGADKQAEVARRFPLRC